MALRVVAGTVGGRLLKTPKGAELRPTQDRIKQAMFSSLGQRVPGARVLDLYAGTGALGIEALSRGAAEALFVEKNKLCARCIGENLATLGFAARVLERDALDYLRQPPAARYDLIFADPPYDKTVGDAAAHPLPAAVRPWIAEGGAFVWEFYSGQSFDALPGWEAVFHRRYGETAVAILIPA
jgi:16S rRNA (guanine966-N2)-methyltransferase